MTVESVCRMWSASTGNYTSEKFDAFDSNFAVSDGYTVVASADAEVPEILNDPRIPQAGNQHPSGIRAWAKGRNATRLSPIMWQVTIEYEGYDLSPGSVEIDWSDTSSQEPIDRDYSGAAIVTVNNEPVEGLTVELADPVLVIRKRFLYVNTYAIGQYRHSTNSDTFYGWPPGTARLVGYNAKNKQKYNAFEEAWDVTARIQFRYPYGGASAAQAWYKRWRHEGIYVKIDGVIQRARDHLGNEVSRPVLLKNDGSQETNANNAIFKYSQVYGSLPYSVLGLE